MQLAIEQLTESKASNNKTPDGKDTTQTANRIEIWGIQDFQVKPDGIVLFFPHGSALRNHEVFVEGQIVGGVDEKLLDLDTYVDFLYDQTFAHHTVVVQSPQFNELNHGIQAMEKEHPEGINHDGFTIIEVDEDVNSGDYEFFATP